MNVYDKWHGLDCLTPLRLFVIRPHPLFWSLKSDSIIMLDILPYDLRLDTRITTHELPISALRLTLPSPPSFWNARHTCLLTLTLHITMILHLHKSEPIKSVHCACEHDVCWADLHPSPRVSRRSFWTLRGTWKFLVNLWILPNMGNMAVLRRAKGYVFKWAPNPALADPCGPPFSNLTVYLQKPENFKSRI